MTIFHKYKYVVFILFCFVFISCDKKQKNRHGDYDLDKQKPSYSYEYQQTLSEKSTVSKNHLKVSNQWSDFSQSDQDEIQQHLKDLKEVIHPDYHQDVEVAYANQLKRLPKSPDQRSVLIKNISLISDIVRPETLVLISRLLLEARKKGGDSCLTQVKSTLLAYGRLDDRLDYLNTYRELMPTLCDLYSSLDGPKQLLVSLLLNHSKDRHPRLNRWVKDELNNIIKLSKTKTKEHQLDRLIYIVNYSFPEIKLHLNQNQFEEQLKDNWHYLMSLIDEDEMLLEQSMLTHPGLWRLIVHQPDQWRELLSFADVYALDVFEGDLSRSGDLKRHLPDLTRRSNEGLDLVTRYMSLGAHPEFIYRSDHEWVQRDREIFNKIAKWLTTCQPGHENSCNCDDDERRRCSEQISKNSKLTLDGIRREMIPPERVPVIGAMVELGQRSVDGRAVSAGLLLESAIEFVDVIPNPIGKTAKMAKLAAKSSIKTASKVAKKHIKNTLHAFVDDIIKKNTSKISQQFRVGKSKIRSFIFNNKINSYIFKKSITDRRGGKIMIALQSLGKIKESMEKINEAISLNNLIKNLADATNSTHHLSHSLQSGMLSFYYKGEMKPTENIFSFLIHHKDMVRYIDERVKDEIYSQLKTAAPDIADDVLFDHFLKNPIKIPSVSNEKSFDIAYLSFNLIKELHNKNK